MSLDIRISFPVGISNLTLHSKPTTLRLHMDMIYKGPFAIDYAYVQCWFFSA